MTLYLIEAVVIFAVLYWVCWELCDPKYYTNMYDYIIRKYEKK